ncbi:hypothetical protein [Streptomyces broussonetiae]
MFLQADGPDTAADRRSPLARPGPRLAEAADADSYRNRLSSARARH